MFICLHKYLVTYFTEEGNRCGIDWHTAVSHFPSLLKMYLCVLCHSESILLTVEKKYMVKNNRDNKHNTTSKLHIAGGNNYNCFYNCVPRLQRLEASISCRQNFPLDTVWTILCNLKGHLKLITFSPNCNEKPYQKLMTS